MKRFIILAGEISYDNGYAEEFPAGWEAFRGDFATFNEAFHAYCEQPKEWAQIIDTDTHQITDAELMRKPLTIIQKPIPKTNLWSLLNRGFITMQQYRRFSDLPCSLVEPILIHQTRESIEQLEKVLGPS